MKQDFLGDLKLCRNDSNTSVGDRSLIPHKGRFKEAIEFRDREGSNHLLLRDTILAIIRLV
jgi:hypothetical protein